MTGKRGWRMIGLIACHVWLIFARSALSCEPIFPPALRPGDTIALVAPAGPLDQEKMQLVAERLHGLGFRTRRAADLYRKQGFLAGSDQVRAEELMEAFTDDEIDAIFPGTGGYGTTRILDRLDYDLIRRNPKILVGFSDITALHLAINKKTGMVTFHSPNPMWGLGNRSNLTAFSSHWFWRALRADAYREAVRPAALGGYVISTTDWASGATADAYRRTCDIGPPIILRGGTAEGRLIGGNLSLVVSLMGTPFEIDTAGKILFLEDIGEKPYRVDRMLCTLRLAGKLASAAGVILGTFSRRAGEDTTDETVSTAEVLREYFTPLGVPVLARFPLGHHVCNATLPIGVRCELDADRRIVRLLEDPVSLPSTEAVPVGQTGHTR